MKALTQSVLAAAMLMALPFAAAEACNNNAWVSSGSATNGKGFAGGPAAAVQADRVARYEGLCANRTTANQFVLDDTPNNEATFRARFMVLLTGTGQFFSANSADGGGGTEVVGLSYNSGNIVVTGATGVANVPATSGTWVSIEFLHQNGQPFQLSVRPGNSDTPVTRTGSAASSGTVSSVRLGSLPGAAGTYNVDGYESTRSAATPIGFLCRGNANNTGSSATVRDINDAVAIIAEINRTAFAAGTPDVNGDGFININDASGVIAIVNSATPGC